MPSWSNHPSTSATRPRPARAPRAAAAVVVTVIRPARTASAVDLLHLSFGLLHRFLRTHALDGCPREHVDDDVPGEHFVGLGRGLAGVAQSAGDLAGLAEGQ